MNDKALAAKILHRLYLLEVHDGASGKYFEPL
jgi:hypothetical protein